MLPTGLCSSSFSGMFNRRIALPIWPVGTLRPPDLSSAVPKPPVKLSLVLQILILPPEPPDPPDLPDLSVPPPPLTAHPPQPPSSPASWSFWSAAPPPSSSPPPVKPPFVESLAGSLSGCLVSPHPPSPLPDPVSVVLGATCQELGSGKLSNISPTISAAPPGTSPSIASGFGKPSAKLIPNFELGPRVLGHWITFKPISVHSPLPQNLSARVWTIRGMKSMSSSGVLLLIATGTSLRFGPRVHLVASAFGLECPNYLSLVGIKAE